MSKIKLNAVKNKDEWALFAKLFIASIVVHWIIMGLGYILLAIPQEGGSGFLSFFYEKFIASGDTPHYINIAKNGYTATGDTANQIVFYPLYPMLMRAFAVVFRDYFISGVIVSNICLGFSGYFLYKLIDKELGFKKAYDGLFIYLLYPFGAFTVTVFTESLFLMLVLMCLYFLKKEKWLIAGIAGLLAALSRSQGIALLVPAVYEIIVYMIRQKKFRFKTLWVFIIPVGTLSYLLLNKVVQGDWFAFVKHQAAEPWYNTSHWISTNLSQHYGMAQEYFSLSLIIYWIQIVLYFVAIIALFYGIKKKISVSLIAFGGAYIFLSYLHGWLISGPRYMMGCVTLYIIYAAIDNKHVKTAILLASGILVVFYTLGVWQGQAIM